MPTCAYCEQPCIATREHIIPRWFIEARKELDTFSARAPVTHLKGDLVVRDVCETCNNGVLADLDAYGKELYERYFATPLYAGEAVEFKFDRERLLRWLLKISYNSARAQNADFGILREYRKTILGQAPIPDHVSSWLHLVAPSYLAPSQDPRPAKRKEEGSPFVHEPDWFRICQFRLPMNPAANLVQRLIIINSFAFTFVIAPFGMGSLSGELIRHINAFEEAHPHSKALRAEAQTIGVCADTHHVAVSIYTTLYHYPSRYGPDPNTYPARFLKGEFGIVLLYIPRELIEEGNVSPIAETLNELVATRESELAFRRRVGVSVDGYNDDPRELWQIPEVRHFFRRLFSECSFVMLLDYPPGGLLKLFFFCWVHEDTQSDKDVEEARVTEFLDLAFKGLNEQVHRLALSDEVCREISVAAEHTLLDDSDSS